VQNNLEIIPTNQNSQCRQPYLDFGPDSRGICRTYSAPSPNMPGPQLPFRVKSLAGLIWPPTRVPEIFSEHVSPSARTCLDSQPFPGLSPRDRTYLVPRAGSREGCRACPTPSLDMSGSLTPPWADSLGGL
jgi:hypothetical protein